MNSEYVSLATSDFAGDNLIQFGGYENWAIGLTVLIVLAILLAVYRYYYAAPVKQQP